MPEATPSFADLPQSSKRASGCARCGAPGPNAGIVQVALRRPDKTGISSKARSMCEPCAVIAYRTALAALDAKLDRA